MSRNEIGNYLGLAVETVSRIFTRFQVMSLIRVDGKEIELCMLPELQELAGECNADCTAEEKTGSQQL